MSAPERILQIQAPHFVAGIVFQRGNGWHCIAAAPIVKYMQGKPAAWVKQYLERKGWRWVWCHES